MATTLDTPQGDILDFDAFGMPFREDPRSFHPMLLEASPGFIMMEGVKSAFVARYDQNAAILRNFKNFSSVKPKGLPGMERVDFFNGLPVMNYSDPPDHTRRRKVVNPAFTPKRTAMLNDHAQTLIDELLDTWADKGTLDVAVDVTKPLSVDTLLRRFLGIADEDHGIFMNYVSTLPLLDKLRPGDPKPQAYLDAWQAGREYCSRQQELARRGESDNLISVIANGAEGGAINDDEMMAMMIVLLIGGVSTVAGAASSALMYLAQNPDVAQRIRQDPTLAGQHLEETLRMDPPVTMVMRFAKENAEIAGIAIPDGMPVYAMVSVANRDPAMFPDPYRFDIDRPNSKDHMAFGQGMHTCIGNAITRNIIPLLIRSVAARFPNLRVADGDDAIVYDVATPRARHLGNLRLSV